MDESKFEAKMPGKVIYDYNSKINFEDDNCLRICRGYYDEILDSSFDPFSCVELHPFCTEFKVKLELGKDSDRIKRCDLCKQMYPKKENTTEKNNVFIHTHEQKEEIGKPITREEAIQIARDVMKESEEQRENNDKRQWPL